MDALTLAPILFRLRVPVILLLHVIGFLAPWHYGGTASHTTLWLAASTLLARTGAMTLANATVAITVLAILCLLLGTVFRVWGTAYLTPGVMRGAAMVGDRLVAAGPYTHVRNPLYLGIWFLSLATSLLMPPDGALFFLVALSLFLLFLIRGEEAFLTRQLGQPYLEYRREVPSLLPRWSSRTGPTAQRPHWLRAALNELYPIGLTLSFAVLAWRYNAVLLLKALLISYGASLVARAIQGQQ